MTSSPAMDLERIRSVTANYFFWQGLRWVPGGVVMLVLALADLGVLPAPRWGGAATLVLLAAAMYVSARLGRYYARTFGRVRGTPGQHARREAIKWRLVYPAMALSLVADAWLRWPFFLSGVVWAAAVVAYWWSTGRGREHYLVAATLLALTALLPAAGLVLPGKQILDVFIALVGIIFIVGGILDHLELRRILRPAHADGGAV